MLFFVAGKALIQSFFTISHTTDFYKLSTEYLYNLN